MPATAVDFSLSASRALRILSSFTPDRRELGLSEISREVALSKTSALRFLQSLEMHGFVERDPQTRKYRPGAEAARVGSLALGGKTLNEIALPIMQRLTRNTGFTSYLSILQKDSIVILSVIEGTGPIRYIIPVGTRIPVHSTATGKVALAQLPTAEAAAMLRRRKLAKYTPHTLSEPEALLRKLKDIRLRGFAVNWEENSKGVASIAAPAHGKGGKFFCMLSIGFAISQVDRSDLGRLRRETIAAGNALTKALEAEGIQHVH